MRGLSKSQRSVLCFVVREYKRRLSTLPAVEARAIGGFCQAERDEHVAVQVAPLKWRTALSLVPEKPGLLRFLRDAHLQPVTHLFLPTEAGLRAATEITATFPIGSAA